MIYIDKSNKVFSKQVTSRKYIMNLQPIKFQGIAAIR